jgi:hypothetical protein
MAKERLCIQIKAKKDRCTMFRVPLRTWSALAGLLILGHPTLSAQEERPDPKGWFVGYETLEMAMNRFRNFAGEVGYRFGPRYQIRMSVMEVDLTERHLSSSWESAAVDGPGVEGYFRGYELHADRFLKGNWYIGGNVGYYADTYEHVQLPDRVDNETLTVGFGIGYARPAPFPVLLRPNRRNHVGGGHSEAAHFRRKYLALRRVQTLGSPPRWTPFLNPPTASYSSGTP